MLMMMHYDVESGAKLELARDASHALIQGHKSASDLLDVQSDHPSDQDETNSDIISILFDIYRCFSQIMSQSSPLKTSGLEIESMITFFNS